MAKQDEVARPGWWMVGLAAAGGYLFGTSDRQEQPQSISAFVDQEGLTGSDFAYYANCAEARAAGADPVREGDPGYAPHLDRDRDGIGCE